MLSKNNIPVKTIKGVDIKPLKVEDLELVTSLYNEDFKATYTLKEIQDAYDNPTNIYIGAYVKEELVGFMRVKSDFKEKYKQDKDLYNLIDKKYCTFLSDLISISKGTGTLLISYLIEECGKFDTDLFTTPFNKDLITYYEKFGFKFIKLNRRKLMKYSKDNFTLLTVFGEMHFHNDDVKRIREEVVRIRPDIIISELSDDDKYYRKLLPNITIVPLEKNLDKKIYVNYKNDLVKQFEIREINMINNINKVIEFNPKKHIVIIVGDTHLRTIVTDELGETHLSNYLDNIIDKNYLKEDKDIIVNIVRSKYKEII